MKRRAAIVLLFLCFGVIGAVPLRGSPDDVRIDLGLAAYRVGLYEEAAAVWLVAAGPSTVRGSKGRATRSEERVPLGEQGSALALILATRALEKLESPLAFECWMNANSILRRQGFRWRSVRDSLPKGVSVELKLATYEGPSQLDPKKRLLDPSAALVGRSLSDLRTLGKTILRSGKLERLPSREPIVPALKKKRDVKIAAAEPVAFATEALRFLPEGYFERVARIEPLTAAVRPTVMIGDLMPKNHEESESAVLPGAADSLILPIASPTSTGNRVVAKGQSVSNGAELMASIGSGRFDTGDVLAREAKTRKDEPMKKSTDPEGDPTPGRPTLDPSSEDVVKKWGTPNPSAFEPVLVQAEPTAEQRELATSAWRYFQRNTLDSGLTNSVDGYRFLTIWDLASQVAGTVGAYELGVVDDGEFAELMEKTLDVLLEMPFYRDELPNREYDARTAQIGASGKLPKDGSGWSTLDIGRLLIWLRIVHDWYPKYEGEVQAVVGRFRFERLVKNGQMFGVLNTKREVLRHEGRYPYEQYSAAGFLAWNVDLPVARSYHQLVGALVDGEIVYHDKRPLSFLTSDPLGLGWVELGGIDDFYREQASVFYRLQEKRWKQTGLLTAVNEDSMDRLPWFSYNSLYAANAPWTSLSHRGKPLKGVMAMSTKAAFLWSAIFDDGYSARLRHGAVGLVDTTRGFLAGRYDTGRENRSFNVNTSGIVLEALLFEARGRKPFLRPVEASPKKPEAESSEAASTAAEGVGK